MALRPGNISGPTKAAENRYDHARTTAPPVPMNKETNEIGNMLSRLEGRLDEILNIHQRLEERLIDVLAPQTDGPDEPAQPCLSSMGSKVRDLLDKATRIYAHTQALIDRTVL
jgi:hypothetical protein